MNWNKTPIVFMIMSGILGFFAHESNAGFLIRISDGNSTFTVEDNAAGDLDWTSYGTNVDGLLMVSHQFGWGDLNFTAGLSKPAIGGAYEPAIHLSALQLTSLVANAPDVVIEVTDTDFMGAPGGLDPAGFISSIGGVTTGSVAFQTFADSQNQEFGHGTPLGSYQYANNGSSAFSNAWSSTANVSAPFSLTLQANISHLGVAGVTSFNAELKAVPEPSSWVAWFGLMPVIGLAVWRTRRRKTEQV